MFGSKNRQNKDNNVVDFVLSKDKKLSHSLDRFGYFLIATITLHVFTLFSVLGMIFSMRQFIAAGSPPVVELADGTTVETVALRGDDRPPEVIKDFVNEAVKGLYSWRSIVKNSNDKEGGFEKDSGVDVDYGFKKIKIPTAAWERSFALDTKLQAGFLQKIAQIIDSLSPKGAIETTLLVERIGEPKQQSKGVWNVDVVSTLIVMRRGSEGNPEYVPINQRLTVKAVPVPIGQNDKKYPEGIGSMVRQTLSRGLQISKMQDSEDLPGEF
jgi:hypothetical protein